jgi:hypothetical protein
VAAFGSVLEFCVGQQRDSMIVWRVRLSEAPMSSKKRAMAANRGTNSVVEPGILLGRNEKRSTSDSCKSFSLRHPKILS